MPELNYATSLINNDQLHNYANLPQTAFKENY